MPRSRSDALGVDLIQGGNHPSTVRFVEGLMAALPEYGVAAAHLETGPSRLSRIGSLSRADDYVRRWVRNPARARRATGDVVHLVDDNGPIARWSPGERTVVTRQDMIPLLALHDEIPYAGPRWYLRRFEHGVRSLARVAAVVCPTHGVRDDILRFCPVTREQVHVIPLAVHDAFAPLGEARRAAVRSALPGAHRHLILHVGTGGFYKNAGAPVEAVRRLVDGGLDCALVRVGAPPLHEPAPASMPPVIDLGRVSDAQLIELYGAVDAFVFPSLAEGFGFPVLEAMACGTPVVASDIPVLREVGADAASFAPPQRPDLMADALAAVITEPSRAALMTAAGLRRAGELTWSRTAAAYARLYQSIAAAR